MISLFWFETLLYILALFSDIHYIRLIKTPCTVKIVVTKWGNCSFIMYNFLTYIMQFPSWKRIEPKLNWWKRRKKKAFFFSISKTCFYFLQEKYRLYCLFHGINTLLPHGFSFLLSFALIPFLYLRSPQPTCLSLYLYSIFSNVNLDGHCH